MKQLLTITLIVFSLSLFGQNPNDALVTLSPGIVNIKELKPKPQETKGSYYYSENWNIGKVTLFSGETIENYPLKYDLKNNQIDIKVKGEIKALSIGAVKEIIWYNSIGTSETLRNSIVYKKEEFGLFLVINDNKVPLLKKTILKVREENYNTAMDVGSRAKKYVKITSYYTVVNENLIEVRSSKRKILKVFKDKADNVKEYAKENKLSFKKDSDLAKIFEYYNSL